MLTKWKDAVGESDVSSPGIPASSTHEARSPRKGEAGGPRTRGIHLTMLWFLFPLLVQSPSGLSPFANAAGAPYPSIGHMMAPSALDLCIALAEATATPIPRYFTVKISTLPRPSPAPSLQDVSGTVVDRFGNGVDGVRVRVWAGNWQAVETTKAGRFNFVLSAGSFQIQLQGVGSDEGRFTVDPNSQVQIEFRQATVDIPTVAPRNTQLPNASATPLRLPTATPTSTTTPTATSTPTPELTPLPDVGTPIPVGIVLNAHSTPTPTLGSVVPLLSLPEGFEASVDMLRQSAIWGMVAGTVGAVAMLAIAIIRR